jgi:hypothetical protein
MPITVLARHPGGVDTFTQNWPFSRFFKLLVGLAIRDAEHGSYNSVFSAAAKQVQQEREKYKGAYLESRPTGSVHVPNAQALDTELGDKLSKVTEEFFTSIGISK